jgi:hypothetical protein
MFGQTFYHKTIRKNVILFGTLFNDIYINREDSSNNQVQTLKIPITYGPKNKALLRLDSDPALNRPFQINVPIMSFEMVGMSYAADRKLGTVRKHTVLNNPLNTEQQKYIYNPVPYDIDFNLYIMTKNAEDGTKILEQILPFFTPDWTTTVNLIPEMGIKLDIPVIIQTVNSTDTYEGTADSSRTIIWTVGFKMKSYLFGPVRKSEVIKLANTNFFSDITKTQEYRNITITPGMLANGSPTSNASLTIDRTLIEEDDDWTYIITKSDIKDE